VNLRPIIAYGATKPRTTTEIPKYLPGLVFPLSSPTVQMSIYLASTKPDQTSHPSYQGADLSRQNVYPVSQNDHSHSVGRKPNAHLNLQDGDQPHQDDSQHAQHAP